MCDTVKVESKISKDLSMSFSSLKTKKLARKVSRSMSIVGMKFPDRPYLTRKTSKARRSANDAKKGARPFEIAIIAPDKTQKQVEVHPSQKVYDVVTPILQEYGLQLDANEDKCKPDEKSNFLRSVKVKKEQISGVLMVQVNPKIDRVTYSPDVAIAVLGGSRAPVNPNASAALLEGELLVLQMKAPPWDGIDLGCFLLSEREYASTIGSAIELYAKPLLKAEILSKKEYHVLFYHLHCVSEASKALCERLQSYIDAGLLNISQKPVNVESLTNEETKKDDNSSILNEMIEEGFLKQSDIEIAYLSKSDMWIEKLGKNDEIDASEFSSVPPNIVLSDYDHDQLDFCSLPIPESNSKEYSLKTSNYPLHSDDNLCFNVQWDFIDKPNEDNDKRFLNVSMNNIFGEYDSVVNIKRCSSDSKILSPPRSEDAIYESLEDISGKKMSNPATPYESIEDLYECLKNQPIGDVSTENDNHSTDKAEIDASLDDTQRSLKSSSCSYTSLTGSSKISGDVSDSKIVEGLEYTSRIFPNRRDSQCSDTNKHSAEKDENKIILNQLINGDLMDVYMDFLSGYAEARRLLRDKMKADEHFSALTEIRRGPAKYTIAEYLELPIERLAQYERLAGTGDAGGRRRGQRLSDLERVQDLFPNDFLALHEPDVVAATTGTLKSKTLLRKRPSLDAALGAGQVAGGGAGTSNGPRQFVMEAPCSMVLAPAAPHQAPTFNSTPTSSPSTPAQERHLFLFTDLLLVAKSRGSSNFKLKETVRVSELWVSPGNSDTNFLLGWAGSVTPTTYILTYPTQAARDSWFRKIQNALNVKMENEPKTTNVQISFKDSSSAIEFSKTLSVTPDMTTAMVIRQALQLVQGGVSSEGNTAWGPARDFCLWVRSSRDSAPVPLIGCERPHAIQMSRIRQTLSNDEGFDLEHVNSKNNPCGMIFELRKINRSVVKTKTPLKLFRRSSGKLFGVSLVRLCPSGSLPAAVLTMLRVVHRRGPHTQGIFRKSANAKALKHLREKVDNAGAAGARCPELDSAPVLLVASLLKDFLRSLPQPLMYDTLYSNWINVLSLNPTEKIPTMRSLLLKLPKAHYNLLSHFVALLHAIARKSSINLMCPMNLAVCVGPSLLWPAVPCDTAPKAVPALIELLILNAEILFGPHLHSIFGKGSPEPSASLSLDSGAEESDSLHSVGLSLDSLDLTCTRKEKLSLSRDSGLTLSEDDSNSNGGNSPAPRNGQNNQILPQAGIQTHQAQRVYAKCYTTDLQNINGLPNSNVGNYDVVRKKNMYVKNTDMENYSRKYPHDNLYASNLEVQKTIEMQQKIYDSIAAQNRYNSDYHDSQPIYGTSTQNTPSHPNRVMHNGIQTQGLVNNSSPSKFLTGLEPEKPPRLGINRSNRNAKVYSMHIENTAEQAPPNRVFCRAKSSDDLLEKRNDKSERNIYNLRGSQENIYGNIIHDNKSQHSPRAKFQKNNVSDSTKLEPPLQSYSRVYGGWEQRVSNYTNRQNVSGYSNETKYLKQSVNLNESIYDTAPNSQQIKQNAHLNQESDKSPSSTIFTRKDWSRQASRTKSLDVAAGECPYSTGAYQAAENDCLIYRPLNERIQNMHREENSDVTYRLQCDARSIDPAHICTKKCLTPVNVNIPVYKTPDYVDMAQRQYTSRSVHNIKIVNQKQNIIPEVKKASITPKINARKSGHSSKYEKNLYGGKLTHSKSLANIVLHSNSSSSDTLYQPSNQSSSSKHDNSYSKIEFSDDANKTPQRKNDLDVFCESIYGKMGSREGIYSSDIYTAKPTSIESHSESHDNSDQIDYQRDTGLRNPLAPPVPPRKASHNSPLKNLPPVHLAGDERKSRSKSVSSIYQEQTDVKNNLKDNKNSGGTRAPITSYHIGNSSEKFILALEDSGTDTESESYV